ncbi:MAG: ATP-binding cassette domain-containing protein [Microscillaceae bacterium]|nr:ATP-binding cassette domain-containing protein [Microscillaceae bacterium]
MIQINVQKTLNSSEGKMDLQINLSLASGAFMAFYGASGAGKTSLLSMLAGLLAPDKGMIEVNGQVWLDTHKKINLRVQDRKIAYVFQDYALFPNMTVQQNLQYALGKKQDKAIIAELIEMTELGDLQHQKPGALSGGQKQRVALARALVRKPDLLLLDEPLSALDTAMRFKLQDYIREMHLRFGLTTILVSHEISEIFRLADQVCIVEQGKILRQGSPLEVFSERQVSGKFQFVGEVLHLQPEDVICVVSVLIGSHLVKVVADPQEAQALQPGDKVLLASKAFNPMIQKIE